jgi:hypothetical protein
MGDSIVGNHRKPEKPRYQKGLRKRRWYDKTWGQFTGIIMILVMLAIIGFYLSPHK